MDNDFIQLVEKINLIISALTDSNFQTGLTGLTCKLYPERMICYKNLRNLCCF